MNREEIVAILNGVNDLTEKTHKEIVKLVLETLVNGYINLGGNTAEEQFLIDELRYYKNQIND